MFSVCLAYAKFNNNNKRFGGLFLPSKTVAYGPLAILIPFWKQSKSEAGTFKTTTLYLCFIKQR